MKKNGWGIVVALGLFVIGLAMPGRVFGESDCACGQNANGGCKLCLPTDTYCMTHPVTDPQCNDSGACEGLIFPDCPAGTVPTTEVLGVEGCYWGTPVCYRGNQYSVTGCQCHDRCVGSGKNRDCWEVCGKQFTRYRCAPICPPTAPTCSSVGVQSATTTNTTGTFYAYAYGVTAGTTNVKFPTWSAVNGQDDIVWYNGVNMGGGTWRAAITVTCVIFSQTANFDSQTLKLDCQSSKLDCQIRRLDGLIPSQATQSTNLTSCKSPEPYH